MKKILIVKIGAIGDVVMALSLLSCFENSHITWLTGKTLEPILKNIKKIDEVITVDDELLFRGSFWQKIKEIIKIQWRLARKFDQIIIGHKDLRYFLFTLFSLGKKRRIVFDKGKYHANEYVRLITNVEKEGKLPKITLPPSLFGDKNAVVIAPGGAKNYLADNPLRRWPITHYVKLANLFIEKQIPVILTGAKTDFWILPYFEKSLCVNLVGKLELIELISLFQSVKLLITHDSGPLHLAKLADCKTLALFGPTDPREKVGKKEKIKVLWGGKNLECRPCYDGKHYAPCKSNQCLANISPEKVFQEALKLIDENSARI